MEGRQSATRTRRRRWFLQKAGEAPTGGEQSGESRALGKGLRMLPAPRRCRPRSGHELLHLGRSWRRGFGGGSPGFSAPLPMSPCSSRLSTAGRHTCSKDGSSAWRTTTGIRRRGHCRTELGLTATISAPSMARMFSHYLALRTSANSGGSTFCRNCIDAVAGPPLNRNSTQDLYGGPSKEIYRQRKAGIVLNSSRRPGMAQC